MFFSVIVPIYKVEKYLHGCIDSVLSQSFSDYELILVDDGSTDSCPGICDAYAMQDARVKVIHKKNGGLVSARQAGIQVAKGEYVFHLDGDDALLPDALESAYEILCQTDADIVSFSYRCRRNGEIGDVICDLPEEGLYDRERIRKELAPNLLANKNMTHMFYFLWGRAIRRELAIKYQMQVNPAISLGEDVSCIVPCYMQAEKVYMSKKPVYLYTIRNDSLTTDFKTHQITQIADTIKGLRALKMEKPEDFEEQIARFSCYMCFAVLALAAEGGHFSAADKLKELIQWSLHREEIQKAYFENITVKSRISIMLMKNGWIKIAFYFLYFCKRLKDLKKKGG